MPGRRLLLVHAHPDDESIFTGVTMAKYAAEGVGVTLVTCTRGELGEVLAADLAHLAADGEDRLGEQREAELDDAMAILGVSDHRVLGDYRDSGMQWAADGTATAPDDVDARAFWRADLTEAACKLVAVIRELRPQVLVTYDPFGGYGHPDHIQAHRVATYAADLAAVPGYQPGLGAAWEIQRILWCTDADPDIVIDAPDLADAKRAAMRAHRSQIPEGSRFLTDDAKAISREKFVVARGPRAEGIAADLFTGIAAPRP